MHFILFSVSAIPRFIPYSVPQCRNSVSVFYPYANAPICRTWQVQSVVFNNTTEEKAKIVCDQREDIQLRSIAWFSVKEREKAMNLHTQRKSHSYFKISALGTRNIMGIHGHSDRGYYHTNGRMVDPRFFYDLTTHRAFKVTGHPFCRFAGNRYCALKISPIFIKFSASACKIC